MNAKTGFFETVRREMRLRNYSNKTTKSYLSCLRSFTEYIKPKHPRDVTESEIRDFLLNLIEVKRHPSGTINQVINALRLLYVDLYKKSFVVGTLPRPRPERKYPDVLNQEELRRLFSVVSNVKHRMILMLAYSSGLRVSEVVRLRLEDFDGQRGLIHIHGGKGKRDRFTVLAESMKGPLQAYWQQAGLGTNGWLFPGAEVGHHLSERSIQAVIQQAAVRAGIRKHVGMHTLRHTFATHLLDHGTDLRYIQELLGHQSVKTTEIYTHVTTRDIGRIQSPLDFMLNKNEKGLNDGSSKMLPSSNKDED